MLKVVGFEYLIEARFAGVVLAAIRQDGHDLRGRQAGKLGRAGKGDKLLTFFLAQGVGGCGARRLRASVGLDRSRLSRPAPISRDFPLEDHPLENKGVNVAGKSKVFEASHKPCNPDRCCIAKARLRMGFRLSVVRYPAFANNL